MSSEMSFRTDLQTEMRESMKTGLEGIMDALSEQGMLSIITRKSNEILKSLVEIQAIKLLTLNDEPFNRFLTEC